MQNLIYKNLILYEFYYRDKLFYCEHAKHMRTMEILYTKTKKILVDQTMSETARLHVGKLIHNLF